jgi:serine/threonine protein kinase
MGAVYLAQQSRPRRTVAVKVVLPGIVLEQKPRVEFLARFRREADAIAALDHINIMPVYEYGEQGNTAYLVMPYVTGGTLRDILEKRGTLSLEEVVPIIEQTAAGLDSAHAQSIIHRDLKPGNILFHADGRAMLADFGLAKVLKDVTESESNGHLTSIGTIVGTPEYLSPEQGTGDPIDYHTDIYSLGIVLYQMLAGRVPFIGPSPVAVAIKHALEAPPPPSRFNPSIPPKVEAVVMKAIAKKPAQRYDSAGAFAQALREAVTEALKDPAVQAESDAHRHSTKHPIPTQGTTEQETTEADRSTEDEIPTETGYKTPDTKEQDPAGPTMLMKEDNTKATEEPLRLPIRQQEHIQVQTLQAAKASPNFSGYADATIANAQIPAQLPKQQQTKEQRPSGQPQTASPIQQQVQLAQTTQVAPTQPKNSKQPVWMIIAGSVLILVLISGGMFAYIQSQSANSNHSSLTANITATQKAISEKATKINTPQTQPTISNTQLPGPYPGVAGIGSRIYGTTRPGKGCDTQSSGLWYTSSNAKLVCTSDASELSSTGPNGNQLSGILLNHLPGNQSMPNTYVIQTQATLKPDSHGSFGISFYNQSGSQPTSYALIINPLANTWTFNYYDKDVHVLTTQPLQTKIVGSVTIDLVASGNRFSLYINGTAETTNANTSYGNTSGDFGLIVDQEADVTFKNTSLYTYNGY